MRIVLHEQNDVVAMYVMRLDDLTRIDRRGFDARYHRGKAAKGAAQCAHRKVTLRTVIALVTKAELIEIAVGSEEQGSSGIGSHDRIVSVLVD